MKTILLSILLIGSIRDNKPSIVYVCGGPKVKRYHLSENCKGLATCSHQIRKMALAEAQKKGKTLCHWEK